MSPESAIAQVLWMPVALFCQLKILEALGAAKGLPAKLAPAAALSSAIGVELLLALRFCRVLLISLLPALVAFSILGLESGFAKVLVVSLSLVCGIAPMLWFLRRLCATAFVLWQGLDAGKALAQSALLSQGKLKSVLVPLLLWNVLAQGLEALGLASETLNLAMLPLSLFISCAALASAYRKLTL